MQLDLKMLFYYKEHLVKGIHSTGTRLRHGCGLINWDQMPQIVTTSTNPTFSNRRKQGLKESTLLCCQACTSTHGLLLEKSILHLDVCPDSKYHTLENTY